MLVKNLRDYVRKLTDEDVKFCVSRLQQRMQGDLAAVLEIMEKNKEMDEWLGACKSADEVFACLDQFEPVVRAESNRRFG